MKKVNALLTCTVSLAGVFLAGCRQDMHDQPKYKPLRHTEFFSDGRQSRPLVANTVARGDLREDSVFYTGKVGDKDVDVFPIVITKEVIERGHQRFDAFCSPCHGRVGNGLGMIVQRGMKQPPSYHIDRLRQAPVGHFYDVISNGYGAMYSYATQIPPRDRWAIVAYLRALQLSQNVNASELPADAQTKLASVKQSEQPVQPGMAAIPGLNANVPIMRSIAPHNPDVKGSPETPVLHPGAPATPLSPTPGNKGEKK